MQALTTIEQNTAIHDQLLEIFRKNERGEFLVAGINDIKFKFDVVNGTIEPKSLKENHDVNISYNPSMFDNITQAGASVMSLLAEREFLFGLVKLNDDGINQIMKQSKIDAAKSMQEMQDEISRVVFELRELIKPSSNLAHLNSLRSSAVSIDQKQYRAEVYKALHDNIRQVKSISHARAIVGSLEPNQKIVQPPQPGR